VKDDRCGGFLPLAERFARDCPVDQPALVSSDASGEGMFIAEVAMRDPHRPSRTVLRGSKELASSQWSGRGYQPKFASPEALLEYLRSAKIAAVVVDDSVPEVKRQPHEALLAEALAAPGESFKDAADSPVVRSGVTQAGRARLFEPAAGF
jgi:hypothetical protein